MLKPGTFRASFPTGHLKRTAATAPSQGPLNPPLSIPPIFLYPPAICDVRPYLRARAKDWGRRQWGRQLGEPGTPG